MTDRPYPDLIRFSGEVVHGLKRGRILGFPTANIALANGQACPADGVYCCWLTLAGHETRFAATVSIGRNPTFDDVPQTQIEAHVHDFDENVYGASVDITLICRLRDMRRFPTVEALIRQTEADVAQSRAVHAALAQGDRRFAG